MRTNTIILLAALLIMAACADDKQSVTLTQAKACTDSGGKLVLKNVDDLKNLRS